MIRQEADAVFKGHHPGALRQGEDLRLVQHGTQLPQIAPGESFRLVQIQVNPAQVPFILRRRAGADPDRVPEIKGQQARHHRIQIHHADGFPGMLVNQNIVDLGIVMGDPQRQNALPEPVQQHGGFRTSLPGKSQLRLHRVQLSRRVPPRRVLQLYHPVRRVMKAHNSLMQRIRRIIQQPAAEKAERPAAFLQHFMGIRKIRAHRVRHAEEAPPDAALFIRHEERAVPGRNQQQGLPPGIPALRLDLPAQKAGHAVNVFHHLRGLDENIVVNPLQDIPVLRAFHAHEEGIIYVTVAKGLRGLFSLRIGKSAHHHVQIHGLLSFLSLPGFPVNTRIFDCSLQSGPLYRAGTGL